MLSLWIRRIWCFQEAALAKKIFWIGLERVPLHISDMTLHVILDLPGLSIQLRRRMGPRFRTIMHLLTPLLQHRLGDTDPTRVMEAADGRYSTLPEDRIYGLMGASCVAVKPGATMSVEILWRKWWEEAMRSGYNRWLMLSWYSDYPNLSRGMENAESGCVVPPLRLKGFASRLSGVQSCRPYGAVNFEQDSIKIAGYCVGRCSSFIHLGSAGKVADVDSSFMTMACLGWGDLDLTMRIIGAMAYNSPSSSRIQSVSEILCSEYHSRSVTFEHHHYKRRLYHGRGREECDLMRDFCMRFYYILVG